MIALLLAAAAALPQSAFRTFDHARELARTLASTRHSVHGWTCEATDTATYCCPSDYVPEKNWYGWVCSAENRFPAHVAPIVLARIFGDDQ